MSSAEIFFLIPRIPGENENLPEDMVHYDAFIRALSEKKVWPGPYLWTLQTYLQLKAFGYPCGLTRELKGAGIFVAHRQFLSLENRPSQEQLLICMKADRGLAPYAPLHTIQNPSDRKNDLGIIHEYPPYFIPHWPQPGLLPRDESRLDRCENVAHFGFATELAPELQSPSFLRALEGLGFHFQIIPQNEWHDYRQVDVVLSVRSFNRLLKYPAKPASKLTNAWLAGVPAILGPESSYQNLRQSEMDYFQIQSLEEVPVILKRIKTTPSLRKNMVENGKARGGAFTADATAKQWIYFFEHRAKPVYQQWIRQNLRQKLFYFKRLWLYKKRPELFMNKKVG